jgi:hypothetical protein
MDKSTQSTTSPSIISSIHEDGTYAPEIHQEEEKPNKVTRFLSKFQSSAVKKTKAMEKRDREEERRTGVKKVVEPVSLLNVCEAVTNAQAKYAWAA